MYRAKTSPSIRSIILRLSIREESFAPEFLARPIILGLGIIEEALASPFLAQSAVSFVDAFTSVCEAVSTLSKLWSLTGRVESHATKLLLIDRLFRMKLLSFGPVESRKVSAWDLSDKSYNNLTRTTKHKYVKSGSIPEQEAAETEGPTTSWSCPISGRLRLI